MIESLPKVLAVAARDSPDEPFITEVTGRTLTYSDVWLDVRRWATLLRLHGVASGSTVVTMLPPGAEAVSVWLGVSVAGGLEVPINNEYRGAILEHVLRDAAPIVVVVDPRFVDAVTSALSRSEVPCPVVLVTGTRDTDVSSVHPSEDAYIAEEWDPACVLYTSGTTGPSKGVVMPWGHLEILGWATYVDTGLDRSGAIYSPFPMCHASGKCVPYAAAQVSSRAVLRDRFSASQFWDDVTQHGCTHVTLVSAMANFLMEAPPRAADAENPLRHAVVVPLIPRSREFEDRFAITISTLFGTTEIAVPFASDGLPPDLASCGRLRRGRQGVEVRLVDDHDHEVAIGEIGELIVRHDQPWTINLGYLGNPSATAAAWRNGWFHTGDGFRCDGDGWYFFVDRKKDAIRRRGENISSFEVESYARSHPDVEEAAAVAVPSAAGEDEIRLFVVPRPGASLDPPVLHTWLAGSMPRFMVPRYITVVAELPRTEATLRVRKAELRAVALDGWDAEHPR